MSASGHLRTHAPQQNMEDSTRENLLLFAKTEQVVKKAAW
jgi:hypothetical protein